MRAMSSEDSGRKTTISSILPMSSGRSAPFTAAIVLSSALLSRSAPSLPNPSREERTPAPEPRLEVKMTTVFLKSTVRPRPSVSLPSSSTWSSRSNTSGCAFSISSKSTTE